MKKAVINSNDSNAWNSSTRNPVSANTESESPYTSDSCSSVRIALIYAN